MLDAFSVEIYSSRPADRLSVSLVLRSSANAITKLLLNIRAEIVIGVALFPGSIMLNFILTCGSELTCCITLIGRAPAPVDNSISSQTNSRGMHL